jgi:hypothetical protein
MDGVLYGAGGFKYASGVMLLCATPSLALMFAGQVYAAKPKPQQAGQNWMGNAAAAAAAGGGGGLLATPWQQQQQQQQMLLTSPFASVYSSAQYGQGSVAAYMQGFVVLSQQSQLRYSPVSQPSWLTSSSNYAATSAFPGSGIGYLYAATAAPNINTAGSSSSSGSSGDMPLGLQHTVQMPAAVYWVWAGMVVLMFMRAATILLPLACR